MAQHVSTFDVAFLGGFGQIPPQNAVSFTGKGDSQNHATTEQVQCLLYLSYSRSQYR